MVRDFITQFNRRKRYLPTRLNKSLKMEIITGRAAYPILSEYVMPYLKSIRNLKAKLTPVDNHFWGKMVTVTGLLTGKDILKAIKGSDSDIFLLPPNCLNYDNLFLDDISLEQFKHKIKRPVYTGSYDIVELIKKAAGEVS